MDFNSRPNSVDSFAANNSNSNHFYHHSSPQQPIASPPQQMPTATPVYPPTNPAMTATMSSAEYQQQYSLYVQQYYREYYRQWLQQHNRQHLSSLSSTSTSTLRQPLKYGSRRCHARAVFSQHNNHVLVVDNTSVGVRSVRAYSLCDLFVDYLFPQQLFHLLLRDNELPFASREGALTWIRSKQQLSSTTTTDFELKLVLRIIQMLLKQNARISGLDLSELLFDLIDSSKQSMSADDDFKTQALSAFRALLVRGQRAVALSHALSAGLTDHALCLAYLMQCLDADDRRPKEDLMIKTIRKFCDSLRSNDAISVFYNSCLNRIQRKHNFLELSFESFLVLLSNDLDLTSVAVKSDEFQHLLAFVRSLMNSEKDFVLSEELFESEMDAILVNECLEFSLGDGKRFNRRLVERKVRFVSLLFDFGFVSNALKYCQQIKGFCDFCPLSRTLVSQIEQRFRSDLPFEAFEPVVEETPPSPLSSVHSLNESIPAISESVSQDFVPLPVSVPQPPLPSALPPLPTPAVPPMPQMFAEENNEIPFSFVSQSPPFNEFFENGFQNNERQNDFTDDTPTTSAQTSEERPQSETQDNKKPSNSGFLSKFLPSFKAKNQAVLPDDSKMTLVFDKASNQWVDTSRKDSEPPAGPSVLRPPPVGPPLMGTTTPAFSFRSQKRYVDITRNK